ncbi:unnamed protein product [Amoebophrya sp. A25]|nr:unnamed protein product [Amoebophrya sp. A25]|eukprot:GSA25T00009931001.1
MTMASVSTGNSESAARPDPYSGSADFSTIIAPVYLSKKLEFETFSTLSVKATEPIDASEVLVVEHGYCDRISVEDDGMEMFQKSIFVVLGDPSLFNSLRPRSMLLLGNGSEQVRGEVWQPGF